jgi:hypothetical protein
MSIPASELVNVIPGVLSPGGNPLSLNGVFLTNSPRIPMGVVQAFVSVDAVGDFFGPTSIEAELAAKYFAGFTGSSSLPSVLYFAQYNEAAVGAYLRSGSFQGTTLAQLQALSGTLIVVIDGATITTPNIDLSTATSFTNAAALIQAGLQSVGSKFVGVGTISDGAGGAGNILNITAVTSGSLKIGDIVAGGVSPAAITALGTGTGGIGTYTVGGAAQDFDPGGALTVASTATASYDAQLGRFLITSPTTGTGSTIGYATGTLSTGIKFTAATGAQLSQGAAAATPAAFMPTVTIATQNWATFMTTFEPDTDTKIEFAEWVQTTNQRFAYVAWDSDLTPLAGPAPASFGALCVAAEYNGIWPQWEPADDNGNGRKAAFICGTVASIDFDQTNGRINFAYKGQAGLIADVTDATTYNNLIANGYNAYCAFATANDRFVNTQPGSTPGVWRWFDPYVNQIWLNSELQLALISLLTQVNSIPYNAEGYNLLRSACNDPIQRALTAAVIQSGVTLSNSQRAQVNTAAGLPIADAIQNNGYYLQILDASPEVRAARESPPMTLWYTDGGSIRNIELSSIDVQ